MIERLIDLTRTACADSASRAMLGKVLEDAGVLRPSYGGDPYETAYAEGRRGVGLLLFELLHACDEALPLRCMREYGQWLARVEAEKQGGM